MPLIIGNTQISRAYFGSSQLEGMYIGVDDILGGDGPIIVVPTVATGINLSGLNYWTEEFPFNNLLRKAGRWRSQQTGEPWSENYPMPPMSEDGYPLSLADGFHIETIVTDNLDDLNLTGPLHLRVDGDDSYDDNFWEGNIRASWPAQMTKVEDGHYTINPNGATTLTIRIMRTRPEDPLRNIRILINDNDDLFRPEFLARQEGMRVLRFMDYMVTNNSPIVDWADYPKISSFPSDDAGYDRVPIEILCEMSNVTNIAPWFCVPHQATDEFVIEMARKITENLTANVPVYIEYSNECWNSMFDQYLYCNAQGNALGLPGDNQWERGAQFYGLRTKQIEQILRPIFGERLKMVFAWQAVNPYFGSLGLEYDNASDHVDVCAIAPYFGSSLGDFDYPPENPHSQQVKDGGLPFVFSYLEDNINTVLRQAVSDWNDLATTHNTEIWCYEAGQHLVGTGPAVDDAELRSIFQAANRDPRMGDMYKLFGQMWNEETPAGSLIAWYHSMSSMGHAGAWGLMENESDTQNVKWLAVEEMLDTTEPDYPTYPPYGEIPEPPEPEIATQAVATRGEVPVSQGGLTTTNNQRLQGRTKHYFGPSPVSEFQVGYASFHVADWTTGNILPEVAAPASTAVQLFIEFNGQAVRATFGGQNVGTLPGGSVLFCDPVLPSSFGLTEFPAGGEFWLRYEKNAGVNNRHQYNTLTGDPAPPITGEATMFGNTSAVSRINGTGTMSTSGWTSFGGYQLPIAIIGKPVSPMRAFGVVGASIEHGAGDTSRDDGSNGGGYIRRAFWANKNPYISLARGSEAAASFINNSTMRRPLLQYCNTIICGHGGNDYSYNYSAANTQTRFATLWEQMRAVAPQAQIYQITLSPKTNSTDSWATLANQTIRDGFEPGGTWRDVVDNYSRAQVATNPNLDGVLDVSTVQDATTDRGKWRIDLGQPTTDGTHPTAPVHIAMATRLRTLLGI